MEPSNYHLSPELEKYVQEINADAQFFRHFRNTGYIIGTVAILGLTGLVQNYYQNNYTPPISQQITAQDNTSGKIYLNLFDK